MEMVNQTYKVYGIGYLYLDDLLCTFSVSLDCWQCDTRDRNSILGKTSLAHGTYLEHFFLLLCWCCCSCIEIASYRKIFADHRLFAYWTYAGVSMCGEKEYSLASAHNVRVCVLNVDKRMRRQAEMLTYGHVINELDYMHACSVCAGSSSLAAFLIDSISVCHFSCCTLLKKNPSAITSFAWIRRFRFLLCPSWASNYIVAARLLLRSQPLIRFQSCSAYAAM